jgi:type I restriction enzyme S subunit
MATNQGCKGIVPGPDLHHKFLFYYLASIVEQLNELGTGATFKELSSGKLSQVLIPVPPLPEQHRVVAILDEALEGLALATANVEKNLANASELFERSIVRNLFGDPVEQGWRAATVENLLRPGKGAIRTGSFGSQLLHGEFVDSGIAVLGIDNAVDNEFRWGKRRFITEVKYAELSRYTARPGDVLITIMGTCGRCAVVPDDIPTAINTKHLCCITLDPEKCLPQFLHAYLLYHPTARAFLTARAKGAVMPGLNMEIIRELPVWLPDTARQARIIRDLESLSAEIRVLQENYRRKLIVLAEFKQSILATTFAGKLSCNGAALGDIAA